MVQVDLGRRRRFSRVIEFRDFSPPALMRCAASRCAFCSRRLAALKYLVHLVADVHQPLHGGYRDDKGGNTYQVQVFGRGSSLHALWDSGLIKSLDEDVDTLTARLQRAPASKGVSDLNPVHAAEESCRIVGEPGFYSARKVPSAYVDRYLPTLEQRLKTAGSRLAGLLNQALD
jgi:hypothetical protein